jgi:hypothetical protein
MDLRRKEYAHQRLQEAVWRLREDSAMLAEVLVEVLEIVEEEA